MTRSGLIKRLASKRPDLDPAGVEAAVDALLEHMSAWLASGRHIDIRRFGTFHVRHRRPRASRNPRTGASIWLPARHAVRFKLQTRGPAPRPRRSSCSRALFVLAGLAAHMLTALF